MIPSISEIIKDKLYLGNEDTACLYNKLRNYKITHILVAGMHLQARFKDKFEYKIVEV